VLFRFSNNFTIFLTLSNFKWFIGNRFKAIIKYICNFFVDGMTVKKILERLVEGRALDPYPSFSVVHLIRALGLIAKIGPIGRGRLSEELKMGEGITRTLIDGLKGA